MKQTVFKYDDRYRMVSVLTNLYFIVSFDSNEHLSKYRDGSTTEPAAD